MNNELEAVCKEVVITQFGELSQHLPTGTNEKHEKRIAGVPAKIQNKHFFNISLEPTSPVFNKF